MYESDEVRVYLMIKSRQCGITTVNFKKFFVSIVFFQVEQGNHEQ